MGWSSENGLKKLSLKMDKQHKRLSIQVWRICFWALVSMSVYESLKQIIFPNISVWQSHIVTVIFSTTCAGAAAYFIFKNQYRLNNILVQKNIENERLNEGLREREQRFTGIIDFLPDATLVINQDGKVIAWNRAMEILTGVKAEEILGKKDYEYAIPFYGQRRPILIDLVLHPNHTESVQAQYTTLKNEECFHFAESYTPGLKKGEDAHLYATASVLRDPKDHVIGAIECIRDHTERKKLEEKLAHSEKKYRDLVDNSPVGIYRTTMKGKILFANQASADILGYDSAADLTDVNIVNLYRHREDREKIVSKLCRDAQLINHTLEMITKEGELKHILMSASLDHDIMSGIFIDVTQQKLAMEENQKLQLQLMRAQKMEALGTLAGGIAHDFNNLLMGIQGNTELSLFNLEPDHSNNERLRAIEELVASGARLTHQLLGFARGGKYEIVTVDINSLLEKSTSLFNRTDKEIAISMKLEENVWAVDVDQGQIEQVFLNILINAGQAMPGGGDLYIETQNILRSEADVKPYAVPPGRYIRISLADTGIGMDEKTMERIFDPFFTTKKPEWGTGLGLASAYGIIKNHGGYITVKSSPGRGSTFTIHLPASTNEIVSINKPAEELLTGNETILIVDDEKSVAAVTKAILENLGYRVFTVGSGQEGVSLYMERKGQIDLIVLDMIMPGMSGEKTYEALRGINRDVKVVLASGYSLDDQTRRTLERGCKGFIQKPFRMHEISRKIREVLDGNM
jgi:two-component system, cell cycle sensor histidine kinase and response regulator CckA